MEKYKSIIQDLTNSIEEKNTQIEEHKGTNKGTISQSDVEKDLEQFIHQYSNTI